MQNFNHFLCIIDTYKVLTILITIYLVMKIAGIESFQITF